MSQKIRELEQEAAEVDQWIAAQSEVARQAPPPANDVVRQATPPQLAPETDPDDLGDPVQDTVLDDAQPTNTPPTDDTGDEWRHKYLTLQGKYNSEVSQLRSDNTQLVSRLQELEEAVREQQLSQQTPPKETVRYVTDEDIEEYGEDMIAVQRRVAQEVAEQFRTQIETQQKEIVSLKKQLSDTGDQVGAMTFHQRLVALVPDFNQIDKSAEWAAWLDEYEPMLNGPRLQAAQKAWADGNAETVAHYVNLFKQGQAAPTPTPRNRQSEMQRQVTPNRTTTPRTPSSQPQQRIYTAAQMDAQWDRVDRLSRQGKIDEAKTLEAELTAAYGLK